MWIQTQNYSEKKNYLPQFKMSLVILNHGYTDLQSITQLILSFFFFSSLHTDVMIGTSSSCQFRINSRSSSIFTCWMSLLKFSSVVPV